MAGLILFQPLEVVGPQSGGLFFSVGESSAIGGAMEPRNRPGVDKAGCLHRKMDAKGEHSKGVNTFKGQGFGVQHSSVFCRKTHLKGFFSLNADKERVLGYQGKRDGPPCCWRGVDMDRKGGGLTCKYRQRG